MAHNGFKNIYIVLALCVYELFLVQTISAAVTAPKNKYTVFLDKKSWEEASEQCASNVMKLVEIYTYKQQNDLRAYIRQNNLLPADENSGYWLGAKLEQQQWIWDPTGKNPRKEKMFLPGWHFGDPDGKGIQGASACMELQYKNDSQFVQSLSWNDISCDEKRAVICEEWNYGSKTE
ncbi:E-selectin-like isoform X2 [Anthonomus grandis grandis]|uniref:E-selectin-like isoform X2 n=1 Tax=Anthonomus grandis grandis TaxID=2921223 RepID=UPI0021659373|nr:E-selectin-like isoform X2 [Anthonomus grandis grandis]